MIKKQIIRINTNVPRERVKQIQQDALKRYKQEIAPRLEKLFDRLVPADVHITLDKIRIDLGTLTPQRLTKELEEQILIKVEKQVREELRKRGIKPQQEAANSDDEEVRTQVKRDMLEAFLEDGFYPSWADVDNPTAQEVLEQLLEENPKGLVQMLERIGAKGLVQRRLIYQFDAKIVDKVLALLYEKDAKEMDKQLSFIQKRLLRQYPAASKKKVEQLTQTAALTYYLQQRKGGKQFKYEERDFSRVVIEQVQTEYADFYAVQTATEQTRVRAEYAQTYQDVDILTYFLENGSIPFWADVDSKGSLQQIFTKLLSTRLVPLQRLVERNVDNPYFLQRLVFQFPTQQLVRLLEPISSDSIDFLEETMQALRVFTRPTQSGGRSLNVQQIRQRVLSTALEYTFLRKRTNFVKQTIFQEILEDVAPMIGISAAAMVEELSSEEAARTVPSEVQSVVRNLSQRQTASQERDTEQARKLALNLVQAQARLEEIEVDLLVGDLSAEAAKELRRERAILQRQIANIEKQQATLAAKNIDTEAAVIEYQALRAQRPTALPTAERERLTKAEEALERKLLGRLPVLLKDLEEALALPKSTERTLLLQRLNREISRIVEFWQQRTETLQEELQQTNSALNSADNSKERQRLRKLRDKVAQELAQESEQLQSLQIQQSELADTIAQLTRITYKDGEDINSAGTGEAEAPTSSGRSKLDYLVFFLEFGATPWWAEEYKDLSIEEIFTESTRKDTVALRAAFSRLGRNPVLWQRLSSQLGEDSLRSLVSRLYAGKERFVLGQIDMLERIHTSQFFKNLRVSQKEFKWSKVLEILLMQPDASEQQFMKAIVKNTAQDFNIAPSQLLELMHNISGNLSVHAPMTPIIRALNEDEELQTVEDELIRLASRQRLQESGMLLSDVEKMSILQDFVRVGQYNEAARAVNITRPEQMENLIAEQLDNNLSPMRVLLLDNLRNPKRLEIVAKTFSQPIFWRIVQALTPSGVTTMERYMRDLSHALQDKQLIKEQAFVLSFARENFQKVFDAKYFVDNLLAHLSDETDRPAFAIAGEWKRRLRSAGSSSSLLLHTMAAEIDLLKKQENAPETARLQVETLQQEYKATAQQLFAALQRDTVENKGVPDEVIPLIQLNEVLQKLQEELRKTSEQILQTDPNTAILQSINLRTREAQLQGQIEMLRKKEPAQLQLKNAQLKAVEQEIERLRGLAPATATTPTDTTQEEAAPEVDLPLSELPAPQRKAETLARIEYFAQYPEELEAEEARNLQQQLQQILKTTTKDNEQVDLLNLLAVAPVLRRLPATHPLAPLGESLQKSLPALPEDEEAQAQLILQRSERISQNLLTMLRAAPAARRPALQIADMQSDIQKNLRKKDIAELLQDWQQAQSLQDELMKIVEKDKQLLGNEALFEQLVEVDEQQITLYRQIRREQERRQTQQLKSVASQQRQLLRAVKKAQTIEELSDITNQLDKAEAEEIEEISALLAATKEKGLRTDIEKTQKNIRQYFQRLRTRYIWQRARILRAQNQDHQRQIQQKEEERRRLSQEREQILRTLQADQKERQAELEATQEAEKKQKERRKRMLPQATRPVDEPLFVKNAGLVILSPFLTRFFDVLKLTANKAFVSIEAQYKAIHLLQYLVTKQIETPENELLLNKVLVGLPVNTPVPITADINEAELKFADSLLQGAINNWTRLKTMSPDSMRSTFLIRTGKLSEEADRWKLAVDKNSFDMLLRTITWGFTFVRYPWLEKSLFVEWNYMQ